MKPGPPVLALAGHQDGDAEQCANSTATNHDTMSAIETTAKSETCIRRRTGGETHGTSPRW